MRPLRLAGRHRAGEQVVGSTQMGELEVGTSHGEPTEVWIRNFVLRSGFPTAHRRKSGSGNIVILVGISYGGPTEI